MESNLWETKDMGSKRRSSPKELRINSQHSSGKSMEPTAYLKEMERESVGDESPRNWNSNGKIMIKGGRNQRQRCDVLKK